MTAGVCVHSVLPLTCQTDPSLQENEKKKEITFFFLLLESQHSSALFYYSLAKLTSKRVSECDSRAYIRWIAG